MLNPGMRDLELGNKLVVMAMSRSELDQALTRPFTAAKPPQSPAAAQQQHNHRDNANQACLECKAAHTSDLLWHGPLSWHC